MPPVCWSSFNKLRPRFRAGPSAASAQQWAGDKPVNVDEVGLRDNAFLAAHYIGLAGSSKGLGRTFFEISLLNQYFRDNPGASWTAGVAYVERFEPFLRSASVERGAPLGRYAESVAKVAKEASGDPLAKAAIVAAGEISRHLFDANQADEAALARQGEAYDTMRARLEGINAAGIGVQDLDRVKEVLSVARSLSDQPGGGQFSAAYDHAVGSQIGISMEDDHEEILTKVPLLRAAEGINSLIDGQGRIRTTLGKIERLFKQEMGKLHREISGVDGKLVGIDDRLKTLEAGQTELLAYVRNETERRRKEEEERRLAAAAQERIDASNAAIFIFSTLISSIDPKVGHAIQALGTATVQIATNLNRLAENISRLGSASQALTSLSSVVITGNIVGAVMTLMPLLVDTGPSPDQLILQEIGALRDDVADLHRHMDKRFDRVDRSLSSIYGKLVAGLDAINLATGRIEGGVKAMHDDLMRTRSDLQRVEAGMYNIARDQQQQALLLRADRALGLRVRLGTAATMRLEAYEGHESFFHVWGVILPFGLVAMGPAAIDRSYDDLDVLRELRGQPLEANIGYLSSLASRWCRRMRDQSVVCGKPFATSESGNYRHWVLAANAYAQLAMDWRQHARRTASARIRSLQQVGLGLRANLRRIANRGTLQAPVANRALFSRALENYNAKLAALHVALADIERESRTGKGFDVDPFAGPSQFIERSLLQPGPGEPGEPWPGDQLCGPWAAEMLSEAGVRAMLPRQLLVAKRFKLAASESRSAMPAGAGDTRLCVRNVRWVNFQIERRTTREIETATLAFEVVSQYQRAGSDEWQDVIVRSGRGHRENVCYSETRSDDPPAPECVEADWRFEAQWPEYLREKFEQDGLELTRNTSLVERVRADVDAGLVGLQRRLYSLVRDAFGSGEVHSAGISLRGAHAAVADLVALGMPRALAGDDLLRSLLYGDQRLLDDKLIKDLYVAVLAPHTAIAWDWLDTDAYLRSPGRNIREHAMIKIGRARIAALAKRLELVFKSVKRAASQTDPLLDAAINRLLAVELAIAPPPRRVLRPPGRQVRPAVRGRAFLGASLTATRGYWAGSGPLRFAYRWLRCDRGGAACSAIAGADQRIHKLRSADVGRRLRVDVRVTNAVGSRSANSRPTVLVVRRTA